MMRSIKIQVDRRADPSNIQYKLVAFSPPSYYMRPLYLSHILVPFQPSAALAARQSCQCQPLFVRLGRARLDRVTFRTRAQEGEKQDIKEEIKQDLRDVKGFFTGSSNAVRLSPVMSFILCSSSLRCRVLVWKELE